MRNATRSASKRPVAVSLIVRGQCRGQFGRAIEVDPPAAARPEQELDEALDEGGIARGIGMRGRQHGDVEAEHRAVGLFDGEAHRHAATGVGDLRAEGAHRQHRGTEGRVEHRRDLGSDERKAVEGVHGRESGVGNRECVRGQRRHEKSGPNGRFHDTTASGVAALRRASGPRRDRITPARVSVTNRRSIGPLRPPSFS